jgi:hypothetical protein
MLIAAFALGACNPFQCTYETRFVGTNGTLDGASGSVTVEYVNLRQYHPDGPVPSYLTWQIRGERLASPATRITLRNGQGEVLKQLSMSSSSAVSFTAGSSTNLNDAEQDNLFNQLGSGGLVVTVELQNGTTVTVPLRATAKEDWNHPSCD